MEMDKDLEGVLMIILNIRNIYTKYLNQVNYVDKQCNQIRNIALRLEKEL